MTLLETLLSTSSALVLRDIVNVRRVRLTSSELALVLDVLPQLTTKKG